MDIQKINAKYDGILSTLSRAFDIREEAVRAAVLRSYSFDEKDNNDRIRKVLQKAARGEKVVVAGLGGSITQGATCKSNGDRGNNAREFTEELGGESCWFNRTVAWFRESYPNAEIEGINAGIGATPSFLGTFRLEQMVLQHKPDLVFVEFSVNDPSTFNNLLENEIFDAYESVVRRCLEAGVAVIQIFMNDQGYNGLQRVHSKIAVHYNVPSISYHNAVYPDGELICDWVKLSPDDIHPNNAGHAFLATCICNYLDLVRDTTDAKTVYADTAVPEAWLYDDTFHKVFACYAADFKDSVQGDLEYRTDTRDCAKWFGTLVSSGVGTACVTVPKGAKRVWVQYYFNNGAFETEFAGLRTSCNTAPIGWPRPMWFRVYTGQPLAADIQLQIRTHASGQAIIMGVLATL